VDGGNIVEGKMVEKISRISIK